MPNWIVFARKGNRPWPYRQDFFPYEYSAKPFAYQCLLGAEEAGASFTAIIPSGKFKAEVEDMKTHIVAKCEKDGRFFLVPPTPYTNGQQFDLSQVKCPKCGQVYVHDSVAENSLTILHHPHW